MTIENISCCFMIEVRETMIGECELSCEMSRGLVLRVSVVVL